MIYSLFIALVGRVLAKIPRRGGSVLGRVIPKSQKIVFDTSLLNTMHYQVYQSSNPVGTEKGAFGSLSTTVSNL